MARLAIVVKVLLVVCLAAGAGWGADYVAGGIDLFPEYFDNVGPGETLEISIVGLALNNVDGTKTTIAAVLDPTSAAVTVGTPTLSTVTSLTGDAVLATYTLTTSSTFVKGTPVIFNVTGVTVGSGTNTQSFTESQLALKAQLNPAVRYAGNQRRGVFPGEKVKIFALMDATKFTSGITPPTQLKANIRPHSQLTETSTVTLTLAQDQSMADPNNPNLKLYSGTLPSSATNVADDKLGDYYIDLVVDGTNNVVPLPISAAGGFAVAHTIVSFPDPMLIAPNGTTANIPVLVEDDGLGPAAKGFTKASLQMRVVDDGLTPGSPTTIVTGSALAGGSISNASSSKVGDWWTVKADITKSNTGLVPQYGQAVLAYLTVGVTGADGVMSFDVEDIKFDDKNAGVAGLGWSIMERGLGDVDGNKNIDALDASLVLMHTVGKVNLTTAGLLTTTDPDVISIVGSSWNVPKGAGRNADVTGMAGISPLDASSILRRRVMDIKYFKPEERAYRLFDAPTGRWNPPNAPIGSAKLVADGAEAVDRTVSLGTVEERDGLLSVPVLIDNMDRVLAGSFTLEFDPQQVQPVRVRGGELTQDYLFADNAEGNTLRVSFAGITWKGDQGTLAEIQLRPLAGTSAVDVRLTEVKLNEGWTSARIGQASALPRSLALYPNFPNPFNPSTTLRFDLPQNGQVELTVYNVVGQQVRTLVKGVQEAGHYKLEWDGTDDAGRQVASGTYMARLESEAGVLVQKMLMVK